MSCLVTGGSGYFGSVLVEKLLEKGASVIVLDKYDSPARPEKAAFINADIRDESSVRDAVAKAETVYHSVAMVPLAKDAEAFWSVNRDGTETLLRACMEQGVRKLVHISSRAVYGVPSGLPVRESSAKRPMEEYGRAKLAAEELIRDYVDKGLDAAIIRPRTIMGHGRLGIMQILFEWIRQGSNVPLLGKGENLYQFVHADDLAEACIKAAKKEGPDSFNVGAENYCSMRETLEDLISHAGTGSKTVSLPMKPAALLMDLTSRLGISPLGPYHSLMYGRSLYFDISHTAETLGWRPRYGNVEMFIEAYDSYLYDREKILAAPSGTPHRSPVDQGILALVRLFLNMF